MRTGSETWKKNLEFEVSKEVCAERVFKGQDTITEAHKRAGDQQLDAAACGKGFCGTESVMRKLHHELLLKFLGSLDCVQQF